MVRARAGRRTAAALLFHGNTMNFYQGAPRFLPPALAAHRTRLPRVQSPRPRHPGDPRQPGRRGAAFQSYPEAIQDNRIAATWLAARGFPRPVVIGHSNGGMLAVRHVADHPRTRALVLLSAHCGGRNMLPLVGRAGLLAQDRLGAFTEKAEQMVGAGKGRELMLLPGWWYVTSAESFLEPANCPDILELAPRVRCPVLYLRGDRSRASSIRRKNSPAAAAARAPSRSCRTAITSTPAARRR